MSRGKFIVFEGLDGSGLTTHSTRLRDWLRNELGYTRIHLTAEPTDAPIGSLIRSVLKAYLKVPKRPDILALLYAADRLYHVSYEPYGSGKSDQVGIRTALNEGYIVISTRYVLSSLAYQSIPYAGEQISLEWLKTINRLKDPNGTPIPDLTFFLDVPPEECMKRLTIDRQRHELFENYQDLQAVYERFRALIKEHIWNITMIDGMDNHGKPRKIEKVQDDIRKHVQTLLKEAPERRA